MYLDKTLFSVEVGETDRDRAYWASRDYLSEAAVANVRSADVVIVPWEGRGKEGPSFPSGTPEFFRTLRDRSDVGKIAIASDPSAYVELSLHSHEVRWPTLFISAALANALGSVVAGEVEKYLPSKSATTIEASVIIERESGKCISINYKGPPDRLIETLVGETSRCLQSKHVEPPPLVPGSPSSSSQTLEKSK